MRDPVQWPIELEFTPWQRFWCALGAWFLFFLPAVFVTLIVLFLAGFAR